MKESNTKKVEKLRNDKHFIEIEKPKDSISKTIRFEGSFNWEKDKNIEIFGNINSTTISDAFRYCIEKNGLNKHLKPLNIRSLCFTRLKSVFVYEDINIYQVWTQHKIKDLVDRNYVTSTMDILLNNYIHKIEEKVLIGSLRDTLKKVIEYKEEVDSINKDVKDNTDKLDELKLENNRLLTKLNTTNDIVNELKETVNALSQEIKDKEELSNKLWKEVLVEEIRKLVKEEEIKKK